MKFRVVYLLVFSITFFNLRALSQFTAFEPNRHVSKLSLIFDSIQSIIPEDNTSLQKDSSLLAFVAGLTEPEGFSSENSENIFLAQQNLLRKKLGFNFSLDFTQNFNPNQQDLEDNILYQRRLTNGLEWNVLKDGYFETQQQLEFNQIQNELKKHNASPNSFKSINTRQLSHLIYWFNLKKLGIYQQRKKILEQQKKSIEELFFDKKVLRDVIMNHQLKLSEVESTLLLYKQYSTYSKVDFDSTSSTWNAPVFDLNYETIAKQVLSDNSNYSDSSALGLIQLLDHQNKWYNEIRLKLYVKHSYYDLLTVDPASRAFFSTGVGLNVPLQFTHKQQNALEKAKAEQQVISSKKTVKYTSNDLLNSAYSYSSRLRSYLLLNQKRIRILEEIRQERVKRKLGSVSHNPIKALDLCDDLLRIDIDLLDLNQELYGMLIQLSQKLKGVPVSELIVPLEIPNYFASEGLSSTNGTAQKEKIVQLKEDIFKTQKVSFLSEYVVYNNFNQVDVPIDETDALKDVKIVFMQLMYGRSIKMNASFSVEKLIRLTPEEQSKIISNALNQYPVNLWSGLTLTYSDYSTDTVGLIPLIRLTKSIADSWRKTLNIELPITSDSLLLNSAEKYTDHIQLRSLDVYDPLEINELIKPYNTRSGKYGFTLESPSFSSRNELEKYVDELKKNTPLSSFYYSDIQALIQLDKKAILGSLDTPVISEGSKVEQKNPKYSRELNKDLESVYIWTKLFSTHTVEQMMTSILKQGFKEVQLAVAKNDVFLTQKIELVEQLKKNGIEINLMFGQNQLLDKTPERVKEEFNQLLKKFPLNHIACIHLDVEPHVRPDWDTEKDTLRKKYIELVKVARKLADSLNKGLSIDLPLQHPESFVNELLPHVDLVRFMCYENIDRAYLLRKLTPYEAQKNKVSLSFRTEDFQTKEAMDLFAESWRPELGIRTLNYHDLQRIIKLTEKR